MKYTNLNAMADSKHEYRKINKHRMNRTRKPSYYSMVRYMSVNSVYLFSIKAWLRILIVHTKLYYASLMYTSRWPHLRLEKKNTIRFNEIWRFQISSAIALYRYNNEMLFLYIKCLDLNTFTMAIQFRFSRSWKCIQELRVIS